ncbi:hypothetical protein LXA43DRAFT_1065274 [Ganoderma leucocontextum]|nr:hypothetical protein LXA43DRAFT_1065274 [Ganoderma leucocontextum]
MPPLLMHRTPYPHPPILKVTRHGAAPIVCKAHEAKVAARGISDRTVITSPNMNFVPEYPVESSVISFGDGQWGPHEYSRCPQDLVPGMWHVACIPSPEASDLPSILWETLSPETHWVEDRSIGFNGIGYIARETQDALVSASTATIRRFEEMNAPENLKKHGRLLVIVLRQVVDRLRYHPVVPRVAVAIAAHAQRVCLELAGLKTYAEIILARLGSDRDYSMDVLPVVGAFVRGGSDAEKCTRVGLPTWFLRPLTHELAVWKVVECKPRPAAPSASSSDPLIFQEHRLLAGVPNLTGNWLRYMLLLVSEHVTGTHLAQLSEARRASEDIREPLSKRLRLDGQCVLKMTPPNLSLSGSSKRSQKRLQGAVKVSPLSPNCRQPLVSRPSDKDEISPSLHSSKYFTPSPFYDVPPVWVSALQAVSPVPRTPNSARYFYPPPFLLDTVSSAARLPLSCQHPEYARPDEKVHRYLHNLVRIREFCRVRMFDVTVANEPLTTMEWRAALWGDYQVPTSTKGPSVTRAPSDQRRSARRLEERKGISRLFGRGGHLPSYGGHETIQFFGIPVDLQAVATNPQVRSRILWEAHEVNFRAELLSLDAAMVGTASWSFDFRLERETLVSTVWGPPSSIVGIFPGADVEDQTFLWGAPPDGGLIICRDALRNFITVLSSWPGFPNNLAQGLSDDVSVADFIRMQSLAVEFYVQTFVKTYARLPIPPIRFTLGRHNMLYR